MKLLLTILAVGLGIATARGLHVFMFGPRTPVLSSSRLMSDSASLRRPAAPSSPPVYINKVKDFPNTRARR